MLRTPVFALGTALRAHWTTFLLFKDARLYGALAATAYFFWRRGILGTIITGTLAMVALRTGLGW